VFYSGTFGVKGKKTMKNPLTKGRRSKLARGWRKLKNQKTRKIAKQRAKGKATLLPKPKEKGFVEKDVGCPKIRPRTFSLPGGKKEKARGWTNPSHSGGL